MLKRLCIGLSGCVIGLASPVLACSLPRGALMELALEAENVVSGTLVDQSTETVDWVDSLGENRTTTYAIVRMEVDTAWHGEHEAQTLVFKFRHGAGFVDRHLGERVVVALHRDHAADAVWPTLPHQSRRYQVLNDGCADYIFPLDDWTNLRGRFLLEMFDGDGDPREEAEVFDRFFSSRGLY